MLTMFCLRKFPYPPRSLREIYQYPVIACTFLTLLGFAFQWWSYPVYVSFQDMNQFLEPKLELYSDGVKLCDHNLTKYLTKDRLQPIFNITSADLYSLSLYVSKGGSWSPPDCRSKYRVNIIVPYRNRHTQLYVFLHYLHRFLMRQEIDYRIVIVEQSQEKMFNRGKLFNIGFREMEQRYPADCYVFHDVDLIPINLNNIYACSNKPRHMCSALDVFDFQVPYQRSFGGVVALTKRQFQNVNGYSNSFFGWGGEDDEFFFRVRREYPIIRFENAVAQYIMLKHTPENPVNPLRRGRHEYSADGLTSLNYTLLSFQLKPLCAWILVTL